MKPRSVARVVSVFRVRLGRMLSLGKMGLLLLANRRIDVLYAALRRRISSLQHRYIKVEFIGGRLTGQGAVEELRRSLPAPSHIENTAGGGQSRPLVSVIIPCFNYGRFLDRAINSVLDQTLVDVEIIVVEGGSTDGETPQIVRELSRPKTRVLIQDSPTLVGANRNAGIAIARGDFVCCLDADDAIDATYLEKAVFLLEAGYYDVVSTGIRLCGSRSGTIDVLETPDLRDMTHGNHVTTCAVFRRHFWEAVGGFFDTGKGQDHVAEDWDFWLRCVALGARVRNITGEYLFSYTVHDTGSLSSTNVRSIKLQRAAILERNKAFLHPKTFARSRSEARRRLIRVPEGRLPLMPDFKHIRKRSLLIAVPFLIVGGAERLLSSLVRYLTFEGWQVTIITTLPQERLEDAREWFKMTACEIFSLPQFLKKWEYGSFIHYIIQSRRVDVVLLAGSRVFYELLPELAEKYSNVAVVDLLFNIVGHTHSHSEYQSFLTYAIAENPEVISWFRERGWPADRVRLLESGVDVAQFGTERSENVVKALEIADDDIVVGFSGRLSEEKAPEVFIKLAAIFRDEPSVRFVMTGSGPLKNSIEAEIKKLPGDTRLQFMGLVESTQEYFATYDIFVLPSRVDGRPMALLEALASGCAIVASDVGGIPALLASSGAGLLCKPANTSDFAAAIRSLISDKTKLRAMKNAAREFATLTLSERQMGADYEAALEAAIKARRLTAEAPSA